MKNSLIRIYLVISLVTGILFSFFGAYSYKGFFYNLGRGLAWPKTIFSEGTEIDGENAIRFADTYQRAVSEHKVVEGKILYQEAMGKILLLSYAKLTPTFNRKEYENILTLHRSPNSILEEFLKNPAILEEVRKETDGMDFKDVIDAGHDASKELDELLSERPLTIAERSVPITEMPIQTPAQIQFQKEYEERRQQDMQQRDAQQREMLQREMRQEVENRLQKEHEEEKQREIQQEVERQLQKEREEKISRERQLAEDQRLQREQEYIDNQNAGKAWRDADSKLFSVLSPDSRNRHKITMMSPEQIEWQKQSKLECDRKVADMPDDSSGSYKKQIMKLNCMTALIMERIKFLKQNEQSIN